MKLESVGTTIIKFVFEKSLTRSGADLDLDLWFGYISKMDVIHKPMDRFDEILMGEYVWTHEPNVAVLGEIPNQDPDPGSG